MQVSKGITTRTLAIVFLVIILLVITLVSISKLWGEFTGRLCEEKQVTDINSMLESAEKVRKGMVGSPYITTLKVQWCIKALRAAETGPTSCNALLLEREVSGAKGVGFAFIDCIRNPVGCLSGGLGTAINCPIISPLLSPCTIDYLSSLSCTYEAFEAGRPCAQCLEGLGMAGNRVIAVREKYKFVGFDVDPETQQPEMTALHEYKIRMEKKDDYVEIAQVGILGQQ